MNEQKLLIGKFYKTLVKFRTQTKIKYFVLTPSTLGKIFSRWHIEIFFLFFPENKSWHFMQDNLHEMSNPVF